MEQGILNDAVISYPATDVRRLSTEIEGGTDATWEQNKRQFYLSMLLVIFFRFDE